MGDPALAANSPERNFANINITLEDGRCYALNVWTFDFLPLARTSWPYDDDYDGPLEEYLLPPDLFVARLDRPTIERVVATMLAKGQMQEQWLSLDDDENEPDSDEHS